MSRPKNVVELAWHNGTTIVDTFGAWQHVTRPIRELIIRGMAGLCRRFQKNCL